MKSWKIILAVVLAVVVMCQAAHAQQRVCTKYGCYTTGQASGFRYQASESVEFVPAAVETETRVETREYSATRTYRSPGFRPILRRPAMRWFWR